MGQNPLVLRQEVSRVARPSTFAVKASKDGEEGRMCLLETRILKLSPHLLSAQVPLSCESWSFLRAACAPMPPQDSERICSLLCAVQTRKPPPTLSQLTPQRSPTHKTAFTGWVTILLQEINSFPKTGVLAYTWCLGCSKNHVALRFTSLEKQEIRRN